MLATHTQLAKKRKESKALMSYIKHTSFKMFLCFRYKKQNSKYIVLDKETFSCCSKYVLHKVSCNVKGILVSKQHALKLKTDCLKRKKAIAFSQISVAQCLMSENLTCLQRLKKQEKFFKLKGKDIICYSLKTLNELEEVKERERQIKTKRAAIKATASQVYSQAAVANPFAKIKILLLPLEVQANQDFASKTL